MSIKKIIFLATFVMSFAKGSNELVKCTDTPNQYSEVTDYFVMATLGLAVMQIHPSKKEEILGITTEKAFKEQNNSGNIKYDVNKEKERAAIKEVNVYLIVLNLFLNVDKLADEIKEKLEKYKKNNLAKINLFFDPNQSMNYSDGAYTKVSDDIATTYAKQYNSETTAAMSLNIEVEDEDLKEAVNAIPDTVSKIIEEEKKIIEERKENTKRVMEQAKVEEDDDSIIASIGQLEEKYKSKSLTQLVKNLSKLKHQDKKAEEQQKKHCTTIMQILLLQKQDFLKTKIMLLTLINDKTLKVQHEIFQQPLEETVEVIIEKLIFYFAFVQGQFKEQTEFLPNRLEASPNERKIEELAKKVQQAFSLCDLTQARAVGLAQWQSYQENLVGTEEQQKIIADIIAAEKTLREDIGKF